jgi:hypothetical protein
MVLVTSQTPILQFPLIIVVVPIKSTAVSPAIILLYHVVCTVCYSRVPPVRCRRYEDTRAPSTLCHVVIIDIIDINKVNSHLIYILLFWQAPYIPFPIPRRDSWTASSTMTINKFVNSWTCVLLYLLSQRVGLPC